jgi:NAD(P)-dependent dehydrogenase (short-subunit alcohol dehydrogenase family)
MTQGVHRSLPAVVVTGAGAGREAAHAERLSGDGFHVVATDAAIEFTPIEVYQEVITPPRVGSSRCFG